MGIGYFQRHPYQAPHIPNIMKKFKRRIYKSPVGLWRDFKYIFSRRRIIKEAMSGELVSEAFRERLMMAVTEVNGCRYCRYYHASEALKAGISQAELEEFMKGGIPEDTPPEEVQALAYAQHWAENDTSAKAAFTKGLEETYGARTAEAIDMILRMIRVGNLLGNTWDYILFRVSFGHFGGD